MNAALPPRKAAPPSFDTAPPRIPGARSRGHGRAHLAAPHNKKPPAPQKLRDSLETPLSVEPGGTSCPRNPGSTQRTEARQAHPLLAGNAGATFQGKVNIQKSIRATAPQAAKFNATIKANLDTWSADTDKAVTHYDNIINLESQLEQEYGALGTLLVQVGLDRSAFVTSVEAVITSEADAKALGGNTIVPGKHVEPASPSVFRQVDTAVAGANRSAWPSEQGRPLTSAEASTVDPPTAVSWGSCYTGDEPVLRVHGDAPAEGVVPGLLRGQGPPAWSAPF